MDRRFVVSLGLALVLTATVRADGGEDNSAYTLVVDSVRGDLERGEWRVVGMKYKGREYPADLLENGDVRLCFLGTKLRLYQGKEWGRAYSYQLNPRKPNEINWEIEPSRSRGIFELKNGTLKIAIGTNERPKYVSGEGDVMLYVLKRVNR